MSPVHQAVALDALVVHIVTSDFAGVAAVSLYGIDPAAVRADDDAHMVGAAVQVPIEKDSISGGEVVIAPCACFVSWCYGQMGLSEPRFAACQSQGIPWFQSHGQWGGRDYANIAPGDAIFFDWDLDGSADHVGLVVGTDGSRVYTVEGNSGDACKIKSYSLSYECIKGYGLMNW